MVLRSVGIVRFGICLRGLLAAIAALIAWVLVWLLQLIRLLFSATLLCCAVWTWWFGGYLGLVDLGCAIFYYFGLLVVD